MTDQRTPLRVTACEPECFTVTNGEALDPILVILQDFGHGRGRITLECYGRAWSAYWGAMGDDYDLRAFLGGTSDEYAVNCLLRSLPEVNRRVRASEEHYLLRILPTVKRALLMEPEKVAP